MARNAPRVPSLWVVLLPAFALVALGARAVVAESQAEEGRVRERTRSTAERLARSLATVVAEYGTVAPADGGSATSGGLEQVLDQGRHLFPRWIFGEGGRLLAMPGVPDVAPVPEIDAYVADALDAAARLGDDATGDETAALFLRGCARAAPAARARDALLLAAAARDLAASEEANRLAALAATGALGLGREVRTSVLVDARRRLGSEWTNGTDEFAASYDAAADAAGRALSEQRTTTWALPGRDVPRVGVAVPRRVLLGNALLPAALCGEIPTTALRDRVGGEAWALVDAGGVHSVGVVAPDGSRSLGAGSASAGGRVLIESVPLDRPFDGWRVEAVAAAPTGVPGSAVALAAAVAVAAGAVVAGALALRRAAREQARLAEERQAFLDHVAHEVRTPAASLLALSEELDAGRVPADRAKTYHGHLATESRRLARLVDDTLDLSRLDAGRLVFASAPVNLRDVAREGAAAAGGGDRVVVRVPEAPVTVDGDGAALRRVVRNLVDNALRHGGSERPVEVEVGAGDALASLAVRDHGRGIAPEHAARLFERFFRVPSATHETKGVGLGLALCREVARAHGGDVDVESEVGRGTTFTLRLPVRGGAA